MESQGIGLLPVPDLHQVVASACDEATERLWPTRLAVGGGDETPWDGGGRPGDTVGADAVRGKDLVRPGVVGEFEHGDSSIRRGACEETTGFVRGPRHNVHRGGMQGEVEDFLPLRVLLPPDEHFAVVAGGGEDVTVLRMGLERVGRCGLRGNG